MLPVSVATLKMFLVVEGNKDAHARLPGPYCVLLGTTADQV